MKLFKITIVMLFTVALFLSHGFSYDLSPVKKEGHSPFRLAYYEGGQYPDYITIFKQTLSGMMDIGWLDPIDLPDFGNDHHAFWLWACDHLSNQYIEFAKDGYFAPGDFDKTLRKSVQEEFLKKANAYDLVIAMGTWAGQDLANNLHQTPVMVGSTSDPIGAGIIKSAEDSGFDHVHAKVDPDRYARQIKIFHAIIGFKKLGVIYEESVEGRTYAAMDILEAQAEELGFDLVPCLAPFSGISIEEAEQNVIQCSKDLVGKVDAVYITVHRGNTPKGFKASIDIFNSSGVPTFSQLGEDEVKNGALMSISQAGFKYVGQFHAMVVARILKGEAPRHIGQIYTSPARIALNMTTAKQIGFKPTVDILLVADEIVR